MTNSIPEQLQAIEEMIQRRMKNTGETRQQSAAHLYNYLTSVSNSPTKK
jgi:hypothetical protein